MDLYGAYAAQGPEWLRQADGTTAAPTSNQPPRAPATTPPAARPSRPLGKRVAPWPSAPQLLTSQQATTDAAPPGRATNVQPPNPLGDQLDIRTRSHRNAVGTSVEARPPVSKSSSRQPAPGAALLELLWFDADRVEDIADHDEWLDHHPLAAPPPPPPPPGSSNRLFDSPPPPPTAPPPQPRRLVAAMLRNAEPTPTTKLVERLASQLQQSDDMKPPLVLVEAVLALQFDPRERLQQLINTANPTRATAIPSLPKP